MHRVVVVGRGFAGLFAAMALRRAPVEVVVVDRTNHHLFQPAPRWAAVIVGLLLLPVSRKLERQRERT